MPPIFVISLARETERREAMRQELAGFDFQFFDAVDGRELDEAAYRHKRRIGGGTRGYLIRLRAAEAMLHYCWRIRAPIGWLHDEWWQSGLTYLAVDPAIARDAELLSLIGPQARVRRTATERLAALSYKLTDWLYRQAVRKKIT